VTPVVTFTTVSTPADVRQILELQASNLPVSLSAETMASQGFVTVKHDPDVLRRMNEAAPSVIAVADGHVVGYALMMPREFAPEVPVLQPMFAMVDGLCWRNRPLRDNPRWFAMGQICVAAGYRGRGIVDGLYATMKTIYGSQYDFTVTEVAERNTRSLRVHERVGFQPLHSYADESTGEVWRVILLELSETPSPP
jgi:ribosomal protein S18 acetylase RimI-like enzyme